MTEASDALRSRDDALRIRPAVRALMITPAAEILLVRFEFPTRTVWAMPGGGVDPGEDDLTALRRELVEETGVHHVDIGPHIWTREHVIPFVDGSWDGQRDHVFHVPIERFEPQPAIGWDAMRAERVHEMRWWTLAQIEAERSVAFAPAKLFRHLRDLIERGLPDQPIDTGV